MKLYEINQEIESLVNPETGEIDEPERFDWLAGELDQKLESLALWYKDLKAESEALKKEAQKLMERRRVTENKMKNLKNFLDFQLCGQRLSTPRVEVKYRKSNAVEIDEGFIDWAMSADRDDLLRYEQPKADLKAIKEAIQSGAKIAHARITAKNNIQIN